MANLTETATYDAGVYQLETADPVIGGALGISNAQAKALANRTAWLKGQVDALNTSNALKAPINSPTFTGTPAAPTPAAGDSDTSLATSAFVQQAISGYVAQDVAGNSNVTLAASAFGVGIINLTGTLTGNINVIFPTQADAWTVINSTTGAFTITCKTAAGSGVLVAQGKARGIICNGTAILAAESDLTDAALLGNPTAPTPAPGDNDNTVATTAFVTAAVNAATPDASDTIKGKVELATDAETVTGTDTERAVTPSGVKAAIDASTGVPDATDTVKGKVELATTAEAAAGLSTALAVTPAGVAAAIASTSVPDATEAVKGKVELATTAEAVAGTDVSRAVTPAGVAAVIAALIGAAPASLNTLSELADALADDANFAATMTGLLALKAPLASPAFSGSPTAPTPSPGDNDGSIATTAFVTAALAAAQMAVRPARVTAAGSGTNGAIGISGAVNVSSVTRVGSGTYAVTFGADIGTSTYTVAFSHNDSGTPNITHSITSKSSTGFTVRFQGGNANQGSSPQDPATFDLTVLI